MLDDVDAIEVFNPRVAISEFNEEAVRFAAKYRIPAGAGSDAHVPQGLGSVRIRMRDFDGPEEFLESLRDADIVRNPASLLYVQALKFLQTKALPEAARRASRERRVRRATGRDRRRTTVATAATPDALARTSPGAVQSGRRCRQPTTRSARSTSSARSAS